MELRRVQLEDVYPDEANPRSKESMGDIDALADSFQLNAVNPGEPVNPIVVVSDGGIYRIVDGERRYRAMRSLRRASCMAVVCEGMDEANAMLAMLATDDKERLTDEERSRGVQQMLLLGVDPEKVEKAGRMAKGSAGRVRRAMAKVDDAAEDMTLDRLLAIEEMGDDDEAVERLANCAEKDWRRVYDDIRADRERREKASALKDACEAAGIAVMARDEIPDSMRYSCRCSSPEDVAGMAASLNDGAVANVAESWSVFCEFYEPVSTDTDAEREAEERRRRRDELEEAAKSGARRRLKWFATKLENDEYRTGVVAAMLEGKVNARRTAQYSAREIGDFIDEFMEESGVEAVAFEWTPWLAAYSYARYARSLGESPTVAFDGTIVKKDAGEWLDWLGACVSDGYQPDEADELLKKACVTAFDEKTDE